MAATYTLYSMQESGNAYKPRLLMHLLGIPFRLIETDPRKGQTRNAEFLALNPNGRVPLLVLPDGRKLSESNAILLFLADGTKYIPADRYERALVNQWLFFEQYEHEPQIAVARSYLHTYPDRRAKVTPELLAGWQAKGGHALNVMEQRLAANDWLVGYGYTIADIALYAYTHVAHEGGFDLAKWPGVSRWLTRVAAEPRHVPLEWVPEPLP
ncbi:MAG TPA: glutathione S-transferase family protein [Dongiaceae bacterium]|nr:glutathione S-transferase family protein [Dongiaceae bacterium]